jgi:hypothetical protein
LIVVTRRYTPGWASCSAFSAWWSFLLGLLFVLVKKTQRRRVGSID